MKTIIALIIAIAAIAGCDRRPEVQAVDIAASAPDATGQGAGGGGRR